MIAEPKVDESNIFSGSMETDYRSKTVFSPASASALNNSDFNNKSLSCSTPTRHRSVDTMMCTPTPCILTMNSKIVCPVGGLVPRMEHSTITPASTSPPKMPLPLESSNTLTDRDSVCPSSSSSSSSSSSDDESSSSDDDTSTTSDTSYQRRRRAKLRRYQKRREATAAAAATATATASQRRNTTVMPVVNNKTNTTYHQYVSSSSPRRILNRIEVGYCLHIRFPHKSIGSNCHKGDLHYDDDFFNDDEQSLSSLSGYDSEDFDE